MTKLADVQDSKSCESNLMWVRFPLPVFRTNSPPYNMYKVLRKFPQPMQAVSRERSKVTPSEVAQSAIRQAVT